jgi:NTE family protein
VEAAGQVLVGLLEDQLAGDVQTLATINTLVGARARAGKRRIPYMLVTPSPEGDPIGQRALRIVREHYRGGLPLPGADVALLARLTGAGRDARHAALLSFLLFAPEFARALIELGRQDAERWLGAVHDLDRIWQLGPMSGGPPPR